MKPALTPTQAEGGFWVILIAALAIGIGLETDWGRRMEWTIDAAAEPPPVFSRPALTEPFRVPPVEELQEMTARPLFIVTRRPAPAAPPPEPPKPSMQKGQFILMGTTIVAEGKFAFLLEKAGNRSRVVGEGKEINGITVREVAADRVVLSQHDDMEVLLLKMNRPAPGTAPPVPVPIPDPRAGAAPMGVPSQPAPGQPQLPPRAPQAPPSSVVGPR